MASALLLALPACNRSSDSAVDADSDPDGTLSAGNDDTSLEALDQRLREASEIADADQRQLVVDEVAQTLIRFHGAEEDEDPDVDESPAIPERDYDVAAARAEFAEALGMEDSGLRRLALAASAEFLATQGDGEMAREFMLELLRANDQNEDGDAYVFASTFAETLGKTDPQAAAEWSTILPERLKLVAEQQISRQWSLTDPMAVVEWAKSIENPAERSTILRATGDVLRAADDETATRWAQAVAELAEDGPRHADIVVEHWARTDVEGAASWMSNLSSDDAQDLGMATLTRVIADQDPIVASEWFDAMPEGEWKSLAMSETAIRWGTKDPAAAAAWVSKLGEPSLAESAAPTIAQNWAKSDPQAARAWISSSPMRAEMQDYVLKLIGDGTAPQ